MGIIAQLLAETVEECVTCDGSGRRKPSGYALSVGCVDCRGTGQMLTEQGHALVEFMDRWLAPKFAQSDHGHTLY